MAQSMFALGSAPAQLVPPPQPSDVIMGGYTLLPSKFYHASASRHALGLVGGNEVSVASGNLVDLESDLRGITRDLSHAPAKQYKPECAGTAGSNVSCPPWPRQVVFNERATGKARVVSTAPRHLPTHQMFAYPGVPAPEPFKQEVYGAPWRF